jgi:hypothetical protein
VAIVGVLVWKKEAGFGGKDEKDVIEKVPL